MLGPLERIGYIFYRVGLYYCGVRVPGGAVLYERLEPLGRSAVREPVRYVTLLRQIGKLEDVNLGCDAVERLCDGLGVFTAWSVVVGEDADLGVP